MAPAERHVTALAFPRKRHVMPAAFPETLLQAGMTPPI
jgi:hypothetical protein